MGYRKNDIPPKPEDMLRKFDVRNGAIMNVAFGCYYLTEEHDPHYHDYINWPSADYHPGPICQMYPPRTPPRDWPHEHPPIPLPATFTPIHLIDEGYTIASVEYEDDELAQNLITEAWIDTDTDYIVRMKVRANFSTFSDKPKDVRFTIFVAKEDNTAIDAICHGIVTVLPGKSYQGEA